jgi:hypothetical protein
MGLFRIVAWQESGMPPINDGWQKLSKVSALVHLLYIQKIVP